MLILSAFTNLCQLNQAYPYYHDLKPNFDFKVHFVDSVKPPKYLPIDHDQASPGDYHDYRTDIDTLAIIPGEHLSKFYQRIIKLSNEIALSNILNGNMALLAYLFIFLLRSTKCATITSLINSPLLNIAMIQIILQNVFLGILKKFMMT